VYQVSSPVKSLAGLALNDESHFLILESHAPVVYVIKSEFYARFDLK
jgi:hypothetical protein